MRRVFSVLTLISVGFASLALMAGPAGAATAISSPTGNPYAVPGSAGVPQAFTVTATGFPPSSNVFIEQCDGVSPSAPGWSPTINCDNLTSPAPVISNASGAVTFDKDDANHAFQAFKGAGPGGLFNCLALQDAPTNNGVSDYQNCKIRVSTNNAGVTGDQVFLNILLPDGGAAPAVTCGIKGTWSGKFGMTHTPAAIKPKPKPNPIKGTGTVGTDAGGACTSTAATKYPISTGTVKIKGKIVKGATCPASLAVPLDGPLTISVKFKGINPKNGKLATAGSSTIAVTSLTSNPLPSVVYSLNGTVIKGSVGVGKAAHLNLTLDDNQLTLNTLCDGSGFKTVNFTGAVSPSTIQLG